MRKTLELETIEILFLTLGNQEKILLLQNSNLNDREIKLLTHRLVQGKSLKECSEIFGIEEDSVNKAQLKAIKKLYLYLDCNKIKNY